MFSKLKKKWGGGKASGPIEFIIAGLGNPGREYQDTRHNAGFLALDYIGQKESIPMTRLKFKSLCGDGTVGGKRVLLIKPSTYMNKSGEGIVEAMAFYKIPIEKVLVLCDDVTLEVGRVRVRRKGSDGGQKGLANIISQTGKDVFPRLRIGVGEKPHPEMDLAAWVLSKFTQKEAKILEDLFPAIHKGVELIVNGELDEAMNQLN